ncbi:hypothetical protein Q4610_21655, partial [Sphingobium sp. HBC34]|nr:hypothetical protein [Sphingobium sp. HBC34]
TPLPYRSGTSFLAWAIVNNNQPVPDVFSKMTKIAASGRLGLAGPMPEPGNRTTFVRASMAEYGLVPLDQQDSAAQAALAAADWLVRSDPGDAHLPASGTVRALRF